MDIFDQFKTNLLHIDPVKFCEDRLTLDGDEFSLHDNGYKPFADIYRYVALKALEKDGKRVVFVKGRQVGATTMAAALECYFVASGLFGTNGRYPMRIMHCFPQLDIAYAYTKDKLDPMISTARADPGGAVTKTGKEKSYLQAMLDNSAPSNNSLQFKKFKNGNQIWIESTGLNGDRIRGRQLALDTELPTPNGWIQLKDLKEGDQLFDEKGNVCTVTKLHPIQESPESYRITFDDGTVVEACAEHLWLTQTKADRRFKRNGEVKNTKEILDTLKIYKESNHSIPICLPIKYSKKELTINPYLLGLWLGDGSRNGQIETADPEVLCEFEHNISIDQYGGFSTEISKSNSYRVVGLTTNLKKLGLIDNPGKKRRASGDVGFYKKHIPNIYMRSSFEQRLALLQGLMDADGYCNKYGKCEFVQVESRKKLAYQVLELIRSLGIKASIKKRPSYRYNIKYQDKYRIQFYTTLPVFKLKRKLKNLKNTLVKSSNRFIKSIEPIASKPMRCITVDSPSHLYLITRSFIPTHNTCDAIFFDECQDIRAKAIANSTKILTQAKYGRTGRGVQLFFGTPKQRGSNFHNMWKSSTQQYYHLGCERCGEYFPLYTPGSDEWESIWLYGFIVECPHCQKRQDKREAAERGKWIALNDGEDCEYIGFHINQLYIPTLEKELIIAEKPENNVSNSETEYQNEVLGEFYSGDGMLLTPEDIDVNCADYGRKFARGIEITHNKRVYLGCDWGKKVDTSQMVVGERDKSNQGGQSYSCCVVLTVEGPERLSIEYASKLLRNDPDYKKSFVDQLFRQYSVSMAVGDIGYAGDLTHILQKEHPNFLASEARPHIKNKIKFVDDEFPKVIRFEKNYYIAEMLDWIKNGRIRFPYGSYEQIAWLITHCCSMETKITMTRTGDPIINYVKGSAPNDGFMALLNAYLAYKFDLTKAFTISHPSHFYPERMTSREESVAAIAAWLPGMRTYGR